MKPSDQTFDQWAIIELFGHQRIAGRVTEQTIGGCSFVRVDVPDVDGEQPFTKLFGQGAIYAITFTDEAAAILAARAIQARPINTWELKRGLDALPAASQPPASPDHDDHDDQTTSAF